MIDRVRAAFKSWFNYLNMLGSLLLAYALAYPGAFAELKGLLPPPLQPFAPIAALAWFGLVQLAKMKAIQKAALPK